MQTRVLVVPDKFKGTLTSQEAAAAITAGWGRGRPGDQLESIPMSDGGDGFGEVLSRILEAGPRTVMTLDAARRPCRATWWYSPARRAAIIESANVVGLAMLPPGKRQPLVLDTFGLASLFRAAKEAGAKRVLAGVGGSATNDGGFGLARGLGWRFLMESGDEITVLSQLHRLASIRPPVEPMEFAEVVVAVDVKNPLLGALGCSRVYGPQKGLRPEETPQAEACLGRLAEVTARILGRDFQNAMGAGAAGGLGFGLQAFLGAKPVEGFKLFSQASKLSDRLKTVDLVITGEGALDETSIMGKATGSLAAFCRRRRLPCVALAGVVNLPDRLKSPFQVIGALVDLTTEKEARKKPARWLEALAEKTAREWGKSSDE